MPIFEYKCGSCGGKDEYLVDSSDSTPSDGCTVCGSSDLTKVDKFYNFGGFRKKSRGDETEKSPLLRVMNLIIPLPGGAISCTAISPIATLEGKLDRKSPKIPI